MNIDVVNKQVSQKLGITEGRVAKVNKFYWQAIRNHIYSYDARPVNIENVCVIHPTAFLTKKYIKYYIRLLRNLSVSKRYIIGSEKHTNIMNTYRNNLRGYWQIRKANKFVN